MCDRPHTGGGGRSRTRHRRTADGGLAARPRLLGVVLGTPLVVPQDVIRGVQLAHAGVSLRSGVQIRVVATGEGPVGRVDDLGVSPRADLKDLIEGLLFFPSRSFAHDLPHNSYVLGSRAMVEREQSALR